MFYCSSLVEWAYERASGARHLLLPPWRFALIFEPRRYWSEYYAALNMTLPNVTGSNPTLVLQSARLDVLVVDAVRLHANASGVQTTSDVIHTEHSEHTSHTAQSPDDSADPAHALGAATTGATDPTYAGTADTLRTPDDQAISWRMKATIGEPSEIRTPTPAFHCTVFTPGAPPLRHPV